MTTAEAINELNIAVRNLKEIALEAAKVMDAKQFQQAVSLEKALKMAIAALEDSDIPCNTCAKRDEGIDFCTCMMSQYRDLMNCHFYKEEEQHDD